jgi:uncharacterized protein (TIGR03437 family)
MKSTLVVSSALLFAAVAAAQPYVISTLTGGVLPPIPARGVDLPVGGLQSVAADAAGNVYFSSLNSVFRVDPNGALTHVAGNSRPGYSGDGGPATSAQLNAFGLAVDGAGNVFIATGNRIRRVSLSGVIVTVAGGGTGGLGDGGPATDSALNAYGVAVDTAGNLFVAGGSRIRKISSVGIITTIAGNGVGGTSGDGGPAVNAQVNGGPGDVAVDRAGNVYLVGDQRIRKISPSGIITTVAGNGQCCFSGDGGQAANAKLGNPRGVAVDGAGNLYIADAAPAHIRKVSPSGIITTAAGNGASCPVGPNGPSCPPGDGGLATRAALTNLWGVAADGAGNLFIAETGNQRVRKVSTDGIINTVAGNGIACCFSGDGGPATGAQLNYPWDVAVDGAGNVFIADAGNRRVREVSPGGTINTLAGNGASCPFGPNGPICPPDGGLATNAPLSNLLGVAADGAGNLFLVDSLSGLRKVAPDGTITTVGNGPRDGISRVTIDSSGNLYVTDDMGVRIRKISPDGTISTVAGGLNTLGSDGTGGGLAVDGAGDVFIADTYNNRIRRVSPSGIIVTVAGGLNEPFSVASDSAGNLFIADTYNNLIHKVSPDGNITTIAGNGSSGYTGDGGPATSAALSGPTGVAVDGAGNIYVADNGNNAVRVLRPAKSSVVIGAVVDAASQRIDPLSPGKIVVIYGVGLGPAQLTRDPNAGTKVSFNGIAAQILYTSMTQVAAVVPTEITGTSAQVTATFQGQVSNTVTVPVALSAPSLFTLNQSGAGQAAAVNSDGTINTAVNSVRIGGFISLYATGWSDPKLPVIVTVGGIPAAVQYAGQAPGQPAGLMQINVQIPNGVQPGGYAPVALRVGDASSIAGAVWIAVSN